MDMDHYTSFNMAYLSMCFCVVPACVMFGCVLSCLVRGVVLGRIVGYVRVSAALRLICLVVGIFVCISFPNCSFVDLSSAVPYSCLLFNMCVVYADVLLLVLI